MSYDDKHFSMEFFPPKNEEVRKKLKNTISQLGKLDPSYMSVTFGAGGSTQQGTMDTVADIQAAGFKAAPHISCIDSTKDSVREMLEIYRSQGIDRLVALRGDIPEGTEGKVREFMYANELVGFIRSEMGDHFIIEVAAYPEFHPEASSATDDIKNYVRKVKAGADSAITQYFYNADAYFRLVDESRKLGADVPIVPGIMPITNYEQLARFSDVCGAEIPRWIRRRLEGFGDDKAAIREFGLDVTEKLCRQLLDGGAPGLHFFTMNQSAPTTTLWKALNI